MVSDRRYAVKVDESVTVWRAPFFGSPVGRIRPFADYLVEDSMKQLMETSAIKLEVPVNSDCHYFFTL